MLTKFKTLDKEQNWRENLSENVTKDKQVREIRQMAHNTDTGYVVLRHEARGALAWDRRHAQVGQATSRAMTKVGRQDTARAGTVGGKTIQESVGQAVDQKTAGTIANTVHHES